MKRIQTNRSIIFGFGKRYLTNINYFNDPLTIINSELITLPKLTNLSEELIYTILIAHWVFLIIGSYFRHIFYKHLYQEHKENSKKTIDRFTLVIALVQHLHIFFGTIEVSVKVLNIEWPRELCRFTNYYYMFSIAYACFGSLGLASFRLLCIKNGHFVKDIVGEKVLANTILFLGIGLAVWINLLSRIGTNWSHLEWEPCLKTPQVHHALEFLEDYELSRGKSSVLSNWRIANSGALTIYLLVTMTELCLYLSFFHHM